MIKRLGSSRLLLIIIVVIIVLIIGLYLLDWWLVHQDPYYLASCLNQLIDHDRNLQNELDMTNHRSYLLNHNPQQVVEAIPSYCSAWATHNKLARALNDDLMIRFKTIKSEILKLIRDYQGIPMVELDEVQRTSFAGQADNWTVIWVRFLDQWGRLADRLPTLKSVLLNYPQIVLLHVSIMPPGTHLPRHYGISKAVLRYHLPLQIPRGNIYLKLQNHKIIWQESQGFVFDDTLAHSVTINPIENKFRILIFADIPRQFDGPWASLKSWICQQFHRKIRQNEEVKKIKEKIATN